MDYIIFVAYSTRCCWLPLAVITMVVVVVVGFVKLDLRSPRYLVDHHASSCVDTRIFPGHTAREEALLLHCSSALGRA